VRIVWCNAYNFESTKLLIQFFFLLLLKFTSNFDSFGLSYLRLILQSFQILNKVPRWITARQLGIRSKLSAKFSTCVKFSSNLFQLVPILMIYSDRLISSLFPLLPPLYLSNFSNWGKTWQRVKIPLRCEWVFRWLHLPIRNKRAGEENGVTAIVNEFDFLMFAAAWSYHRPQRSCVNDWRDQDRTLQDRRCSDSSIYLI